MLQRLGDKRPKYFAVMDLTSGYWQAPLAEEAKKFTAFRTARGTYQWKRVPMGLKNAGSYFQEQMCKIIGSPLLYNGVEVYLDDVIVYGATEAEYLANLKAVFARFKEHKVRLSPSKCRFGVREVEYVGHLINAQGKTFSDEKKNKVLNFPKPTLQKHLKSFIGLGNYFRDHVANHSALMAPLQDLVLQYKPGKPLAWTPETEASFERAKAEIGGCQQLFWMAPDLPVFLHTDASDYGVGAYLFQVDKDGKEKPIQFLSKSFTDVQKRWSTIEKECYAIFYSITALEHLIRDRKFTLRTDHRNLIFLNAQASAKVTRWKLAIQEYDFDIEHIAGVLNFVADQMSRLCADGKAETFSATKDTVAACLALACGPSATPTAFIAAGRATRASSRAEGADSSAAIPPREFPARLSNPNFKLISSCHGGSVGHGGVTRTVERLKEHLAQTGKDCWPTLTADVRAYIRQCPACQKSSQAKPVVLTEPFAISSDRPMEKISIDTMGPFPVDAHGNIYVIVIIDCFSRYVELFPASDCTAEAATHAIAAHVAWSSVPRTILSDNGPQYANKVIDLLADLLKVDLSKTTPYSHEENGIVERANKEVLRHLRDILFDRDLKQDWSPCLPLVQRIMNATVHSAIGVAPASIITPALDLNQGILFPHTDSPASASTLSAFLSTLQERQALVIRLAQKTLSEQRETNIKKRKRTDEANPVTEFAKDSYVLVAYPQDVRVPKLRMPLQGPFQVVSNTGPQYKLRDLVSGKLVTRHVKLLRAYRPSQATPLEIARRDQDFYLVEKIISHTGTPAKKGNMTFRVRWLGYGPESDSLRAPWHDLRTNFVLHEYLRAHGMGHIVPAEFQTPAPAVGHDTIDA
jgi:transposase InsO family protein